MEAIAETDRRIAQEKKNIPGWGIDADPKNDPTYPMKHRNAADYERLYYDRPAQQPRSLEILQSIERPDITRVFGTSTPPSGLSGILRRYAFKFSEASSGHWLTLILADRINVVEGIIDDLRHGYVPNIFAERGWNAEWKYNRNGAIKSIAVGLAVTTAIVTVIILKRQNRRSRINGRTLPY